MRSSLCSVRVFVKQKKMKNIKKVLRVRADAQPAWSGHEKHPKSNGQACTPMQRLCLRAHPAHRHPPRTGTPNATPTHRHSPRTGTPHTQATPAHRHTPCAPHAQASGGGSEAGGERPSEQQCSVSRSGSGSGSGVSLDCSSGSNSQPARLYPLSLGDSRLARVAGGTCVCVWSVW